MKLSLISFCLIGCLAACHTPPKAAPPDTVYDTIRLAPAYTTIRLASDTGSSIRH